MLKIVLFIGLIALSTQHKKVAIDCTKLDMDACIINVSCWFEEISGKCNPAEYEILGHRRDTFSQSLKFARGDSCDNVNNDGDFVASRSFVESRMFKSWCYMYNISKIKVNDVYYDSNFSALNDNQHASSAVIYPIAPEGCALVYSHEFYTGSSWLLCGPTKLNGQTIKSIMLGKRMQISLYNRQGKPLEKFQQLSFQDEHIDTEGITDIPDCENVEYVLVEQNYQ